MTIGKYNDAVLSLVDIDSAIEEVIVLPDQKAVLTGIVDDYFSTPHSVANSVAGSIDIRVKLMLPDWTPDTVTSLIGKYIISGNQRSYRLYISTTGNLYISVSSNGTSTVVAASTITLPSAGFVKGSVYWVRATWNDLSDTVNFYTSTNGTDWTILGASGVSMVSTGIYDSTSPVEIGSIEGGTSLLMRGEVHKAEIYDGIDGTLVSDFNPDEWVVGKSWVSSVTGEVWYIKGNSFITSVDTLPRQKARLTGGVGDYFSTPDSVANSILGDIDIRAEVALDDWLPAAHITIYSKWVSPNIAFLLVLRNTGELALYLSANGAGSVNTFSTIPTGFIDGTKHWLRATWSDSLDQANFYTSDDGVLWDQLGTADLSLVSAGIYDSPSAVAVGAHNNGTTNLWAGDVHRIQLYDGINGTLALDFNPDEYISGTEWVSSTGETWTINGFASVITAVPNKKAILPGGIGNYFSTPDSVVSSVTGSIEIVLEVLLSDWTPALFSALHSKYGGTLGAQSYNIGVQATGILSLYLSDGTTLAGGHSDTPTGFTNGTKHFIKVTWNNATDVVNFYTSDDGILWDQLGSADIALVRTNINDSTFSTNVGAQNDGTINIATGEVHRSRVYDGIDGTLVVDFNPDDYEAGTEWVSSTTGETWTINGTASIVDI